MYHRNKATPFRVASWVPATDPPNLMSRAVVALTTAHCGTEWVAGSEESGACGGCCRQLEKQKKEMQAAEFLALQEQGLNPYQVFRQRDIDAEVERQKQRIAGNIAGKKDRLGAQLDVEEGVRARELGAQAREEAVLAAYQKEMGVAAQQQRVEGYIKTHTAGGLTMLDPTGELLAISPPAGIASAGVKPGCCW
jgi:hypothetical protein